MTSTEDEKIGQMIVCCFLNASFILDPRRITNGMKIIVRQNITSCIHSNVPLYIGSDVITCVPLPAMPINIHFTSGNDFSLSTC